MRALENDLIVLFQLVKLLGQLSDTVIQEAIHRNLFNLANKVTKVNRISNSFCNDFKANLSREQADDLEKILKDEYAIDALDIYLSFIQLAPEERDQMREIIKAVTDHKPITINDVD